MTLSKPQTKADRGIPVCMPIATSAWRHVKETENTKGLGFHSNRQWQCLREKVLYVRPKKSQFHPRIHYLETTRPGRPSAFKVRISTGLERLLPAVNVSRAVLR